MSMTIGCRGERWQDLAEDLLFYAYPSNEPVALRSGGTSRTYYAMKDAMLSSWEMGSIVDWLFEVLRLRKHGYVLGVGTGGALMLGGLMHREPELFGLLLRDTPKPHGPKAFSRLHGMGELSPGAEHALRHQEVVVVDDVATTGASLCDAAREVALLGGTARDFAVLVDRRPVAERMVMPVHALIKAPIDEREDG